MAPLGSHKRIGHGGGINGFASFIARYPDDKVTVVVLSNLVSAPAGRIADELARLTFGETVEPLKRHVEISLKPEVFDAYAGSYQLQPNFILKFWREGSQYFTQATNQPVSRVYPESEDTFFLKEVDAQVTFVKGPGGNVTHLVLHQNGNHEAKRLP